MLHFSPGFIGGVEVWKMGEGGSFNPDMKGIRTPVL
jgi:hypothetical protein